MKVSDKRLRKIVVNDNTFSWIVSENKEAVKIRCYHMKSTYVELIFLWDEIWAINLHKPAIVAAIIKKAIKSGWNYQMENQVISVQSLESKGWIVD